MTHDEHRPAGPADDEPRDPQEPASDPDAPVIDPQDPLGLGDLSRGGPRGDDDAPGVAPATDGEETAVPATGADGEPAADGEAADGEPTPDDAPTPHVDPTPDVDLTPDVDPTPDDEPPPDVREASVVDGADTPGGTTPAAADPHAPVVPAADVPVPPAPRGPDEDAVPVGGADERVAAPAQPEAALAGRSAWGRLRHAMRPRITSGQLLAAALCALLGLALVVQVRQTTDAQLGSLRQDDLVRLLDETTTRADELAREAADLQRERDELLSGSDRQQAALDAARRNAATQGILTGRLPATGPGVHVTLHESEPGIKPATMLHVLEELRNAGAEAVQLNDMRVTASSAFTGTAGAIVLDGVTLSPPYRWVVIGDPDTIATALEIPGGAMATVRRDGGRGTVDRLERVDVTALRQLPDPVYATPVPDAG
ncbi:MULTISPECIES: DUF881 domain-containing protein [Cellulomonas]|uniref:DUF881 domain-containing protein n=1 Tax=Cellulomonas TaxID=1707 RepID=UPI0014562810|nr:MULTISPECIES: DUF881 domain-containing protein [Cellulomonas]